MNSLQYTIVGVLFTNGVKWTLIVPTYDTDTICCYYIQNRRFQVLVSLMLSSQTKDEVTSAACQRLRDNKLATVDAIIQADTQQLEDILKPVSFYKVCTRNYLAALRGKLE